ncbi:DUF5808 domain-containing protein [Neobacillus sp. OS1-2]|uniref:DUF1648 domain-containing protein n=1 Tax=Neobacillus sp. OS1-2 TaxID=3070680 RepID=UPI0027DF91AB|nr:DUF5808 domain-containing protein [Neobacillus sp. OS1-2]WML39991.1 DUF5808 domain-containing protein [Neobacillus sp. OS1-2]
MSLFIFLIISLFLLIIQTAIPFLVKRTVVFGVTIPEPFIKNEKLADYKKRYALIVFFASIITLGIYTIWALTKNPTEELIVLCGTVIQFGIVLISMSLYFYFHGKIVQLKKTKKWKEDLQQVQITDLSIRLQDEMLPWYVYVLPITIAIGLIGYTIFQYTILPEQIPTHWGIKGKPDAFTEKTPFSAISMTLVLLVMQFMFLGMNIATKKSGIKLSATSTQDSRLRQLALRKYSSWFMFLTSLLITLLFSCLQLSTIHPKLISNNWLVAIPLIFLLVILVGNVIFAVKVGRTDKKTTGQVNGKITDFDEDSYWKGGLFYFNRNDPSIFVEKRFGVGWTLNFANPIGYLLVIAPILLILLFQFL